MSRSVEPVWRLLEPFCSTSSTPEAIGIVTVSTSPPGGGGTGVGVEVGVGVGVGVSVGVGVGVGGAGGPPFDVAIVRTAVLFGSFSKVYAARDPLFVSIRNITSLHACQPGEPIASFNTPARSGLVLDVLLFHAGICHVTCSFVNNRPVTALRPENPAASPVLFAITVTDVAPLSVSSPVIVNVADAISAGPFTHTLRNNRPTK